jgi:hypothetical protein
MKTTFKIKCRTCSSTKQSEYCDACGYETRSHDYVKHISREFVKGLWHESSPFRYRVEIDDLMYRIESYGSDNKGVFLELYREDEVANIIKIYPKGVK